MYRLNKNSRKDTAITAVVSGWEEWRTKEDSKNKPEGDRKQETSIEWWGRGGRNSVGMQ